MFNYKYSIEKYYSDSTEFIWNFNDKKTAKTFLNAFLKGYHYDSGIPGPVVVLYEQNINPETEMAVSQKKLEAYQFINGRPVLLEDYSGYEYNHETVSK